MVIRAPSPGLLWGGRTPKTHSLGQRCPPIVIGKSFLSARRTVFLERWHWSIHHGFVPLRTPRAHRGSAEPAIYHSAEKNRERSEEMHISHRLFLKAYNSLTYFQFGLVLLRGSLSPVWFIRALITLNWIVPWILILMSKPALSLWKTDDRFTGRRAICCTTLSVSAHHYVRLILRRFGTTLVSVC